METVAYVFSSKSNEAVKRERYISATLEDVVLAQKLAAAKIFSTHDAAKWFYQLPLDNESAKLTTFTQPMDSVWNHISTRMTSASASQNDRFALQSEKADTFTDAIL